MPEKPERIGKYVVLDILGKGGMGIVYKARDPVLNRTVAIKMMVTAGADDELRTRFYREAQSLGTLRHKNIMTIYDLGQEGENPYMAMEFLTGIDLDKTIKSKQAMDLTKKIDIIRQVCDGLECAHKAGIIHRDIKPANIRVLDDGTVKIMDFGIARMSSSATMTRSGLIMGTVHYMSPEQIKGMKVDGRSDIFSVGAVLYELLTYVKPFHAETMTSVLYKIVNDRPPALQALGVSSPPELEKILDKALAKDVSTRYSEIGKMARDLRELNERLKRAKQDEAVALQIDGLLAEGEQRMQGREEAEPPAVTQLLAEGRELFAGQFYEDALQRFRAALALDPGNVEAVSLIEGCEKREEDERRKIRSFIESRRHEVDTGPQYVEFDQALPPPAPAPPLPIDRSGEATAIRGIPTVKVKTKAAAPAAPPVFSIAVKVLAAALAIAIVILLLLLFDWLRQPAPVPGPMNQTPASSMHSPATAGRREMAFQVLTEIPMRGEERLC